MERQKITNHNTNSNRKVQYKSTTMTNDSNLFEFSSGNILNGNKIHRTAHTTEIFGGSLSNGHNSSDVTEMTQLRPRGSAAQQSYTYETTKAPPDNVVFLEREILPSDTLQSFALLYGCTVNDIKRANNLISEQDFFALRRIKIPVKRHGMLTEPEEEIKRRPVATTSLIGSSAVASTSSMHANSLLHHHGNNPDVYHSNIHDEIDSSDSIENINLLSPTSPCLNKEMAIERNDTSKYLKKVDKEIRKTVRKNDKLDSEKNEILEEVVSSMGSVGYRPLPLPGSQRKIEECNGTDWGVKWWALLLSFVGVLAVIGFLLVYMYNSS